MSGGSLTHSRISLNVCNALEAALEAAGKSYFVYNSDAAARLSARRYTYPDASVTCDEGDRPTPDKTEVQVPRVIVEVLSDSTEAYDRGRKFGYYRACPHVQEYTLIATKYQLVEVYRQHASFGSERGGREASRGGYQPDAGGYGVAGRRQHMLSKPVPRVPGSRQ